MADPIAEYVNVINTISMLRYLRNLKLTGVILGKIYLNSQKMMHFFLNLVPNMYPSS